MGERDMTNLNETVERLEHLVGIDNARRVLVESADIRVVLDALAELEAERKVLFASVDGAMDQRDELAAVIERARGYIADEWDVESADRQLLTILNSAPADVLRERDAEKWDEGFDAGERDVHEHVTWDESCIPNPYREGES